MDIATLITAFFSVFAIATLGCAYWLLVRT